MYIIGIGLVKADSELNVPGMRRAGRFAKIAAQAAQEAVKDSGVVLDPARTGIILATNFGPHVVTFEFLDNILTYSEKEVSPTLFSHSVHNAAAFYIAHALKINGPTLTLTDFDEPFYNAFLLAKAWLDNDGCEFVLVGKAEESGKVMDYIMDNIGGKKKRVGDGALFLLLSKNNIGKIYSQVKTINKELLSGDRLDSIAKAVGFMIQLSS